MKILYTFYCNNIDGNIFIDNKVNLIGYMNGSDALYRSEYMSFIPKFFGGEIKEIDFDFDDYDELWDEDAIKECLNQVKEKVLVSIKKVK